MKSDKLSINVVLLASVLISVAASAQSNTAVAPASAPAGLQLPVKPVWLTELSLTGKEAYDNNVFMSDVGPHAYVLPSGSVVASEYKSSFVTTVTPKIAVNLAPLFGNSDALSLLALSYAPDFVNYQNASSENYDAHRFSQLVKGKIGKVSYVLDNSISYIDGSDFGPVYPGALFNAYATIAAAQRREQIQDKGKFAVQYDSENWFIRPTGSMTRYDMMTKLLDVEGYQNYPDRYDMNGGADFGYKIAHETYLTVGYRYGTQYQQQMAFLPYSSSSTYQRALLGLEGKPTKWLNLSLQGGPDFRNYDPDTASHITPVNDLHPVKYYGEAAISVTPTANDAITFKYRQYQWVSICGKIPLFDSLYDLSYHHKLSKALALDLGGKAMEADYTSGNLAGSLRNDMEILVTSGVTWTASEHLTLSAGYTADLGRNLQGDVVDPQNREFGRHVVALTAQCKF